METIALEQTCNILSGYAFKSKEYVSEGIRIIRIANVQKGYIEDKLPCYYPYDNKKASSDYALVRDDLLISLTGNVGRVGLMPDNLLPAALNQRVACLRVKEDSPLTKEFIYAVLNSDQFEQEAIESSNGVAQKNLSVNWLKQYQLPLLTKTEQASFCKRFSVIDSNCLRIRTATSRLDDLIKSRFVEMFGALEPSVSISDACIEFIDGDWIESKDQSESGIRLIQTGNIGNGDFRDKRNRARYISEQTFEQLKCHEVYANDVLISRLPDPVGRACIVPSDAGRSITAVDCSIVRLKKEWEPSFFVSYTMTKQYEHQIQSYLTGTTRKRISRSNLGKIKIPAASFVLQQEFATFVAQVDKLRFELARQCTSCVQL